MRSVFALILIVFLLGFESKIRAQDSPPDEGKDTVITSVEMEHSRNQPATFSTVTHTPPVGVRKVSAEKIQALQKSDDYWYANLEPEKPKENKPDGTGLFYQQWFWSLLWILVLCSFIAIVVWYLASSNISLFRRKSKTIESEAEEEAISDDIFSIHYDKEIRKAEEAANYRLAVRLWYLRTLKTLADKSVITYRAETPNGDYVAALFGGPYYRAFFRLTRAFDYTWYGLFPLSDKDYAELQAEFLNFKNSLSA